MSELMNTAGGRGDLRWHLLMTVSSLALIAAVESKAARASDASEHPTVWIELGGQLERIDGREDLNLPPFMTVSPTPGPFAAIPPWEAEKPSIYSYGVEGKVLFRPEGAAWSFSAAVRYGRSNNDKHTHQQTELSTRYLHKAASAVPYRTKTAQQFADFRVKNDESHAILDFQIGRDVGLGWLSSVASFGIRAADFTSESHVNAIARPVVAFKKAANLGKYYEAPIHTDFTSVADNERGFHGVGPSLSWEGNIPVLGGPDGTITFDWGVNAAALFGRQKAGGTHETSGRYYSNRSYKTVAPYGVVLRYHHGPLAHNRSRSVIVPNVGGLAGVSFRYSAAKVSLGYRADFFLGAMDMGIDARDTANRNFYGPFATISIGLGG